MENAIEAGYLNENGTDRLARLVRYYESAEMASTEARRLAERDRDYYDNDQWTQEELSILKKRKQPPITINRIKPKVNFLLGQEAQRRSLPKAYPRNKVDEEGANAASDALRYVVEDNQFPVTRSACFKNLCIEGVTAVDIAVRQVGDDFKVDIRQIEWDRLFYDPHSRKMNFSDAKYFGQVIWMDEADALTDFPGSAEVLSATYRSEASISDTYEDTPRLRWTDPKRKRIRIVELWHIEGGKWYQCIYTKGGILSEMESPYVDDEGNSVPGFALGSAFIDRDGNRYGIVRDWIGIQDEINKRRSKALHLLSVRQVKAAKGAVEDKNKTRQELARPDGYIETVQGMDFEILPTGDMAAAQLNLLQEAKSEIDSVGVNAALSGSESRALSGRAINALKDSGLAELGPLFDALNQWDLDVYRMVWHRIKQFWTQEKWVRVTDDERNVQFVGINVPLTLGEQLLEKAKQQGMQITPDMVNQARNDPMMQQVVGLKNNVAKLDVDIVIGDAPASASLQAEQFEILAGLAKGGLPIPPKAIIQASNLRNKEQIIKDMGGDGPPPEVRQIQQQMQQMGQRFEMAMRELQELKASKAIESRKVDVQAYEAETDRLEAAAKIMEPALQAQATMQAMQSPDLLPMPPPPQQQPRQPGAGPGFFTPNQMRPPAP